MNSGHLTAGEAARELGVSRPTLYAYVSRGLVRSESVGRSRERRYRAEDVAALKHRKIRRRDPGKVAEAALHWGLPVLDSAISLITGGGLYYRGRDALALATTATLEEVAALLWKGDLAAGLGDDLPDLSEAAWAALSRLEDRLRPVEAFQVMLPIAEAHDSSAYDLRPPSVERAGLKILRLFAAVATRGRPSTEGVARVLAKGWTPSVRKAPALFEAALVLSADHELNPSTFTARCAASSGSTPYAVVAAGLASLQGFRHGGTCERIEALFDEAGSPKRARATLEARLRRGELIPGFGHPIYPEGDPRARVLVGLVERGLPRTSGAQLGRALVEQGLDLFGLQPTIDLAVVMLCRALELGAGAAVAVIALGRSVGWIAHAIEQYQDERLIRPRARYVGALPAA